MKLAGTLALIASQLIACPALAQDYREPEDRIEAHLTRMLNSP